MVNGQPVHHVIQSVDACSCYDTSLPPATPQYLPYSPGPAQIKTIYCYVNLKINNKAHVVSWSKLSTTIEMIDNYVYTKQARSQQFCLGWTNPNGKQTYWSNGGMEYSEGVWHLLAFSQQNFGRCIMRYRALFCSKHLEI